MKKNKNIVRILSSILVVLLLAGCTLNQNISLNTPLNEVFVNQEPDPIKENTGNDINVPDTDDPEADNTDPVADPDPDTYDGHDDLNEFDIVDENNTEYPSSYYLWHESIESKAAIDVHFQACDKNEDVLWERVFPEIMVGQYDSYTMIYEIKDNFYLVVDGTLYAINVYTGLTSWKVDYVGSSCSFDVKDNVLYITGYEGPALVVIDEDGNVLHRYETFTNANDLGEYFWACDLFFEDDTLIKKYDSSSFCLVVDPETGEAYPEEFEPGSEEQFEKLKREWEFGHYQRKTEDFITYAKDITGECEFEIYDDYYVTFNFEDRDLKLNADFVKGYLRPRDLYDGVRDDFYGEWILECEVDPWNSFAMQMTEPDKLEVMWFVTNGSTLLDFYKFEFDDAELMQYYRDKLELNSQNK